MFPGDVSREMVVGRHDEGARREQLARRRRDQRRELGGCRRLERWARDASATTCRQLRPIPLAAASTGCLLPPTLRRSTLHARRASSGRGDAHGSASGARRAHATAAAVLELASDRPRIDSPIARVASRLPASPRTARGNRGTKRCRQLRPDARPADRSRRSQPSRPHRRACGSMEHQQARRQRSDTMAGPLTWDRTESSRSQGAFARAMAAKRSAEWALLRVGVGSSECG